MAPQEYKEIVSFNVDMELFNDAFMRKKTWQSVHLMVSVLICR